MKVPLLDLNAVHEPLRDELTAAFARVLSSQGFILGKEVEGLEREAAAALGVEHALGVSSGTDALLLALMALGVGPGDEVITTDFSFFATAGAIARLGATPVFVDIDPASYGLKAAHVDAAVTPRTKAIIPVHLFGRSADDGAVFDIAARRGIPVVEDAAQAFQTELADGRMAGTVGAIGCFSFFPSKNLGALGDAGLVVTRDPALADRMKVLRGHGARKKYVHEFVGGNFRIDALQAALLRVKLPHLASWNEQRRANAARYRAAFARTSLVTDGSVLLPHEHPGGSPRSHTYHQFVIRIPGRRDDVKRQLEAAGIQTEVYYPVPFHAQACFAHLGTKVMPESLRAAAELLALPIAPGTHAEGIEAVVDAIADACRPARVPS